MSPGPAGRAPLRRLRPAPADLGARRRDGQFLRAHTGWAPAAGPGRARRPRRRHGQDRRGAWRARPPAYRGRTRRPIAGTAPSWPRPHRPARRRGSCCSARRCPRSPGRPRVLAASVVSLLPGWAGGRSGCPGCGDRDRAVRRPGTPWPRHPLGHQRTAALAHLKPREFVPLLDGPTRPWEDPKMTMPTLPSTCRPRKFSPTRRRSSQELQFVMDCCKRLLAELAKPEKERDPVMPWRSGRPLCSPTAAASARAGGSAWLTTRIREPAPARRGDEIPRVGPGGARQARRARPEPGRGSEGGRRASPPEQKDRRVEGIVIFARATRSSTTWGPPVGGLASELAKQTAEKARSSRASC